MKVTVLAMASRQECPGVVKGIVENSFAERHAGCNQEFLYHCPYRSW